MYESGWGGKSRAQSCWVPLGMAWRVQSHACTMQPTWLKIPFWSFLGWIFATNLRCTVVRLLSWAHSQPHFLQDFVHFLIGVETPITASTPCKSRLCHRFWKQRAGQVLLRKVCILLGLLIVAWIWESYIWSQSLRCGLFQKTWWFLGFGLQIGLVSN